MSLTLGAGDDLAAVGRNIHSSYSLVMSGQLILERVLAARALVQVDNVLPSYSERLAVGGEGVVRDGMVEEVVDFWGSHYVSWEAIGDSLLLQYASVRVRITMWSSSAGWRGCDVGVRTVPSWHLRKVVPDFDMVRANLQSANSIVTSAHPTFRSLHSTSSPRQTTETSSC